MSNAALFPTHEQLSSHLQELAARHPHLVTVDSIARSHQGRDVWLVTLTDRGTGRAEDKPALYMDGHIHAEEFTAGQAVIYLLDQLVERFAAGEPATRDLLSRRTFYLVPRVNPDGAHIVQTTPYPWVGNGRLTPPLVPERGLYYEDVDGDGLVLWMRQLDPAGEWKVSTLDPRLLIPRSPGERGGTYYRLYPEGRIAAHDGGPVLVSRPQDGNMNRHFPADWDPEEYGGGSLPLAEPESRALAECLIAHPNIGAALACHTHSGVLLPPEPPSETAMSYDDMKLFEGLNKMGEEITSYPVISVLKDFTVPGMPRRHGVFSDWAYTHLGMISYTIELWDAETEAGISKTDHAPFAPLTEAQHLQLLRWNDAALGGEGFVRWRPLEHPELGAVEVGGWKYIQVFRNPPTEALLQRELDKVFRFTIAVAEALPSLHVTRASARQVGDGLFIVEAVVANDGYAPTAATSIGAQRSGAMRIEIDLGDMELLMGDRAMNVAHLSGRAERPVPWNPWVRQWTANAHRVEWLIRAPRGGVVTIRASGSRAGTVSERVSLA
jgi:murein tripeptide amidase MpaA